MSTSVLLAILVGVLFATGVYLLLERSLTRVLLGVIMVGNGVNVFFLIAAGRPGTAPIIGLADPVDMSDPLPQALVLTAIVITLGVTAFVLAMAYRSWQLTRHDDVQDDVEDALIRRLAAHDAASASYDDSLGGELDEEGTDVVEAGVSAGEATATGKTTDRVGPEGERP